MPRRHGLLSLPVVLICAMNAAAQDDFPIPKMTSLPRNVKPFEYADANIAFYPPGGRAGSEGWNKMQLPLPAAESQKHIVTPVGFEVRLFAAEPDIARPICMAWDERGRLWIAESVDYPNDLQKPPSGRDRIKICEDTNNDGRADRFTIFAEQLSIPTSLTFSHGGVIVHQAPQTLFLKDTNGDDKADVRSVLLDGWSTGDTHAGPSNLQYGLDNWIWGVQGYAGFSGSVPRTPPSPPGGEGRVRGEKHKFGMGFYRFKPDGSDLEFVRSTNNNTWGIGFSEEGITFASTANRNPSVYMPIANRYYERVRGWSASQLGGIADTYLFKAVTDKIRQVDHHGGYTAAAGHALYTARTYPREYWNRTAFVCEPTGHLVGTFVLRRDGADFASTNPFNLFAGADEWIAPTMAEVGPDGHVWVVDWYNYIVQHNPTPAGFKTGKGNAYETPLRDKTHGRIYRVVYTPPAALSPEPGNSPALHRASPKQLVEALRHDNMLWRKHAQRLLVERSKLDVVPDLIALARDKSVDAIGLNTAAIHALWTLHGLGVLDDSHADASAAATACLSHPSAGVRRNAVLVLPSTVSSIAGILDAGLLKDADAQVRLATLLALGDMPANARAGQAVADACADPLNHKDRWLVDGLISAAAAHDVHFLTYLPEALPSKNVVAIVAEHYARGKPSATLNDLLVHLAAAKNVAATETILNAFAKGWPRGEKAALNDPAEKAMSQLLTRVTPGTRGQLVRLATTWGSKSFEKYGTQIAAALLTSVLDAKLADEERTQAAQQLINFRPDDATLVTNFLDQLTPQMSPALSESLLRSLGSIQASNVGVEIIKRLPQFTPRAKGAALGVLLARADATAQLLDAAEKNVLDFAELTLDQRQALAGHPNGALAARARKLLARGGGLPSPDREKVLQELLPIAQLKGDARKGKLVFKTQCAKCHSHSGEGQNIGPDLTGMATHPKAELLTQILDPSRSVEGNFRVYTVVTSDGRVLNGLLASETKTSIELIDTEAKKHALLRQDIEQLLASPKSLMPDGFEKQVSREDLINLLEFLAERGKYLPLDLSNVASIVSTRGMFYSEDATAERLIFPDWSPRNFEGVPFRLIDPKGDRVPNAIMLYGPNGVFPPKMPRSVSLPWNAPARAIHLLSGVSGWGAQRPLKNGGIVMVVRLHYEDGKIEDHPLRNGEHFADYIRRIDVPASKFAYALRSQQIRYLAVQPRSDAVIARIELAKGPDNSAPVVMAVTVETREP